MAAYEPIRDSFREFNRMIIDAQTWDAKRGAEQADFRLKEVMLKNQLEQQAFNNMMAKGRYDLAVAGHEQGVQESFIRQAQWQQQYNQDMFKLGLEQEQNNITNDLNERIHENTVSNQAAVTKDRTRRTNAQERIANEQVQNFQAAREEQLLKNNQLKKEAELTPIVFPDRILNNPGAMAELDEYISANYGTNYGGKIPKYKLMDLQDRAEALAIYYDDTNKTVENNTEILKRNVKSINKQIKDAGSDNYNRHDRIILTRDRNMKQGAIDRNEKLLAYRKTPEGKVDQLAANARKLYKKAHLIKNKDLQTNVRYHANALNEQAKALYTIAKETIKADQEEKIDKTLWSRMNKVIKTKIEATTPTMFSKFKGDTSLAINSVEKIMSLQMQKDGITRSDINTEALAIPRINAARDELIRLHDLAATAYQEAQAKQNNRAFKKEFGSFQQWVNTKYKPMLKAQGIMYIPKQSFLEQVGMSD